MDRRNALYYAAAAGTVLVFIIALVGLTTCGDPGTRGITHQEQAVLNAYQQGYLDGYSKGYADGFAAGRGTNVVQQSEVAIASSRGCGVPVAAAGVAEFSAETEEEQ